MPNEEPKPTTSEDKNAELIVDQLKAQDEKIAKMEKQLDETLAYNRKLLSTPNSTSSNEEHSKEERHKYLEDKLRKGLKLE